LHEPEEFNDRIKALPSTKEDDRGDHYFKAYRAARVATRFLYPFFFEVSHLKEACTALRQATVVSRNEVPVPLWESPVPHALYREELLEHVVNFLFGEVSAPVQTPSTSAGN